MFTKSAARDTRQGQAIQAVNEKWSDDGDTTHSGRETIGIPVCKKKYAPFRFRTTLDRRNGRVQVHVERLLACACHDAARKRTVQLYGLRPGWEPFGQWSLKKAQEMAKQHAARLNNDNNNNNAESETKLLMEEEEEEEETTASDVCSMPKSNGRNTMCMNGTCLWKVKSAYDDVYKELTGESDHEDFDYYY